MFIIVTGNPIDGISFHGPFRDDEYAIRWAEEQRLHEWWLTEIDTIVGNWVLMPGSKVE